MVYGFGVFIMWIVFEMKGVMRIVKGKGGRERCRNDEGRFEEMFVLGWSRGYIKEVREN